MRLAGLQKLIVFLYTSDKHVDTKSKNAIPLTITRRNELLRSKSNETCTDFFG